MRSMPKLKTETTSKQVLQNQNEGHAFRNVDANQTSHHDTDQRAEQSSPNEIPNDPFFHESPSLGLETPNSRGVFTLPPYTPLHRFLSQIL